jgi:hypothetical protein
MSLAKKDTRRITVNSHEFRWRVAPNDEPGMAIVIESAKAPAQRVVTWVEHGNIISPCLVRRAILNALEHGWHPQDKGPELVFRFDGIVEKDETIA